MLVKRREWFAFICIRDNAIILNIEPRRRFRVVAPPFWPIGGNESGNFWWQKVAFFIHLIYYNLIATFFINFLSSMNQSGFFYEIQGQLCNPITFYNSSGAPIQENAVLAIIGAIGNVDSKTCEKMCVVR